MRDNSVRWQQGAASGSGAGRLDAVVLDAALRQSLVAVRELGRDGRQVGAVELQTSGPIPTFSSRHLTCHALIPVGAPAEQAAALVRLLEDRAADVLIPSHDGTIEMLRAHREEIERHAKVALAAEPALAAAVDKEITLRVAAELGIPIPRSVLVKDPAEIAPALAEIGLPAVLKPSRSWVANHGDATRLIACAVADAATAHDEAARMLAEGGTVLVQEMITGQREAVSFVRAGDVVAGEFAQRALRTYPALGGSSVLREAIALPADALADARKLTAELGLDGYAEVEFRRDSNGRAVLMEINPRLSASVEVAVRAGVDMPGLLLAWARGEVLPATTEYRTGVRMRWLGGDLAWLRETWRRQGAPEVQSRIAAVTEFARTVRHPHGYDYFSASDPKPALTALARGADDVARRARRKAGRSSNVVRTTGGPDVVVIGAGPYGLSVSANLRGHGVDHRVFGSTMSTWRDHMPQGMILRSENSASNLSDPDDQFTLANYCADHAPEMKGNGVPVPLTVFDSYSQWFVDNTGVQVEDNMVQHLARTNGAFRLELDTGEVIHTPRVVMAIGVSHYSYVPEPFSLLPPELCSHTSRFDRLDGFAGQDVTIIGAGQSARETAVLLHEHGATVRCLGHASWIRWDGLPLDPDRSLAEKLRAPAAGMGPGWGPWLYEKLPNGFRRLPAEERSRLAFTRFGPTGAWWLRPRFEGKVPLLLGRVVRSAKPIDGGVHLEVDGPDGHETYDTNHVIAATGYKVNLDRLTFLDPTVKAGLDISGRSPVLTQGFESSVPGLHFVGISSAASYGPINRFVLGARFSTRRVAAACAR